ncbi:family 20 glycosylhydrolase [Terrimonas sp. NA20]|uniref:beta-N-acetylhexosaminidase n=1 Tax=Terrimonas ginsenosidimutans TaxID=2908004 RepID=A0ABS9KU46_9BACT|nr:glycoside hydrolase family 20 zincin-like fold domain-containing protein [Terrimonas ginsenosidimutans]MCG2615867.1 family 20 glycosylhydrolase [Terrimonas ginsenosidimutans]
MKTISKNFLLLIFALFTCAYGWSNDLPVLPYPQTAKVSSEAISFPSQLRIQFQGIDKASADRLLTVWNDFSRTNNNKLASSSLSVSLINNKIKSVLAAEGITDLDKIGKEGYVIIINHKRRLIVANTETGLFYGLQTVKQLTRAGWNKAVTITDWPSFEHRVIYDDISRGPIPTMDYFKQQIERMAELKLNYLSFYIEHVVQPVSYPDFAPANGKLTIAQIRELSAYAAKFHMQLIGSFQSFGHFEKILALPKYKSMGETSTLISPRDPEARKFLASVIGELCDAFSAPYFNVNCDETFDLGKGRSKEYVDSVGPAKFYADHLKFLYDVVKAKGKRMMMWGDVALQHEEVLDMLPKDVIYLTWEYGDKKSFDPWILPFKKRGLEFMVCPGILNSYRMFPDMAMAKANINGFLEEGKKNGSTGAFTTIWDDGGTYLFAGDWYGVYVAADKSWNVSDKFESTLDKRFSITAHQSDDDNYVKALFKLMELRGVEMTYNLNDQLWHQKILPDSGKQLIINNASVPQAAAILQEAVNFINAANAKINLSDIDALKYAIGQYQLIVDTRKVVEAVVKQYAQAASLAPQEPRQAQTLLNASVKAVSELGERYLRHAEWFRKSWLRENQEYWLDKAFEPYAKKIRDLEVLKLSLQFAAVSASERSIPAPSSLRLNVAVSDRFYFKNWMLGGPFPLDDKKEFPAFIYSSNKEYDKPPSPGDFTHYLGKTYRWQKFSSTDGGIIDLDDNYKNPLAVSGYAYCLVNSPKNSSVKGFLMANDEVEVFCNGEKVFSGMGGSAQQEAVVTLPLKEGVNHVLLKLKKRDNRPWSFTFRMQEDLSITNHKHKYTLNAKDKVYEAD